MKRLFMLILALILICSVASASSYPAIMKSTRNGQIVHAGPEARSRKVASVGIHDSISESVPDLSNRSYATGKQIAKSNKSSKTEKKMKVAIKATCKNKNHVGKNWQFEYMINNEKIKNNSIIKVKVGQTLKISTEIVEYDKYPDVGTEQTTHTVTDKNLKKGFKIEQTIVVTEGHGRYAGNSCTWKIVYTFK